MTHFLVALAHSRRVSVGSPTLADEFGRATRFLQDVAIAYAPFLGPRHNISRPNMWRGGRLESGADGGDDGGHGAPSGNQPHIQLVNRDPLVAFLEFPAGGPAPEAPAGGQQDLVAVSDQVWQDTAAHNYLLSGGVFQCEGVPRGQFAAARWFPHAKTLAAWATNPALEGVFYSSSSSFTFVSNRALLCALAAGDTTRDEDYLSDYLTLGYSLSDATPFKSVKALSGSDALLVRGGQGKLVANPSTTSAALDRGQLGSPESVGADLAEVYLDSARQWFGSGAPSASGPPSGLASGIQVRMSGGIDSRVIVGVLQKLGIPFEAVTFGQPHDPDPKVAAALARTLNFPLQHAEAQWFHPGKLIESSMESTRLSGGLLLGEAHQLPFAPLGEAYASGISQVALGHWPLYKGGLNKRMRYQPHQVDQVLLRQQTSWAAPRQQTRFTKQLDAWREHVVAASPMDTLRLYGRDMRGARNFRANAALFGSTVRTPYIIAENAASLMSDLVPLGWQISQRVAFHMLAHLNPELVRIPLADEPWVFDRKTTELTKREEDALGVARQMTIPKAPPPTNKSGAARGSLQSLSQFILASSSAVDSIRDALDPAVLQAMEVTAARGEARVREALGALEALDDSRTWPSVRQAIWRAGAIAAHDATDWS